MNGVVAHNGRALHVGVAILTALPAEETAVVKAIGNCSVYRARGQSCHLGEVGRQRILVSRIGMGNTSAAVATSRVIDAWRPAQLMLVGIAGGAQGSSADMRLGDILVPDQVVGYELAKVTPGDTARRYEVYRPDPELLACARSLRAADWADGITVPRPDDSGGRIRPAVHVGPVLTGDKIIADKTALADLQEAWPKAIGIEMEGLGVALAAYAGGARFLMVKAVSDFADGVQDNAWQRYAAEVAARFAVAVLARSPRILFGQVDEDGRGIRRAAPLAERRQEGPILEPDRQLTFDSTVGNRSPPITVHVVPLDLLSDMDILVVPNNVYFEMSQHFKMSLSAAVWRASVRRSTSGEITADVVRNELRDWLLRGARPGLPVPAGTVVVTSPGEMAANNIRRLYHVAITAPRPGTNDYHVEPSAVAQAVRNVLAAARTESDDFDPPLRSICFPLLGAGRGGLDPATSFSWMWAALERESRGDIGWDIHFIIRNRKTADLVIAGLVKVGAIPKASGQPGWRPNSPPIVESEPVDGG